MRVAGLLTLSAAVLCAAVVAGAVITLALSAAGLMPVVGQPALSGQPFTTVAPDLALATRESLVIATASTLLAAVIGLGAAIVVLSSTPGAKTLAALAAAPIPIAHIVAAASFALLLSDAGLFNRLSTVDTSSWPSLVAGPWPIGSVAAFAWKESAFVALVISAAIGPRLRAYSETAALLGANSWQRITRVFIPLALPSLLGACIIVFLYTVGSYEVVWLLGRAYPEPLPVTAYRLFTSVDLQARPQAAAVALVSVGLALAAAAATVPLLRRLGVAR
ncbi:MAG: ABC transporter permease subunit [Ornithinimicrobium sp.]